MNDVLQKILPFLEDLKKQIENNLKAEKAVATGESLKSLEITTAEDRLQLLAGEWFSFIETGRGPGKIPFGLQVDNKETKFHIKRTIPVEIRTTRLNKKMTDIVICAECC